MTPQIYAIDARSARRRRAANARSARRQRAANARFFLSQIKNLIWRWAPVTESTEVEIDGPDLDIASTVVTSHGRRFRITVQELEQ